MQYNLSPEERNAAKEAYSNGLEHHIKATTLEKDNQHRIFNSKIDIRKFSDQEIVNVFNGFESSSPFPYDEKNKNHLLARSSVELYELQALQKGSFDGLKLTNLDSIEREINRHLEYGLITFPEIAAKRQAAIECDLNEFNHNQTQKDICEVNDKIKTSAMSALLQQNAFNRGAEHDVLRKSDRDMIITAKQNFDIYTPETLTPQNLKIRQSMLKDTIEDLQAENASPKP